MTYLMTRPLRPVGDSSVRILSRGSLLVGLYLVGSVEDT